MTQVCDLPHAEREFSSLGLSNSWCRSDVEMSANETERAFLRAQVKEW
jgi:hypothetical protein